MRTEILGIFFEAQRRSSDRLRTPYYRYEVERLAMVSTAMPEDIAAAKLEREKEEARAAVARSRQAQRRAEKLARPERLRLAMHATVAALVESDVVGYSRCPLCGGMVQVRKSGNSHMGICSM